MLFPFAAVGPHGHAQLSLPPVIFLEPDLSTVRIENVIAQRSECSSWPIELYRPRQFTLRGQILDSAGANLGRYFLRGVLTRADGSHVAQYALTLNGVGTVAYTLDASPEVFPYETVSLVLAGAQIGNEAQITAAPSLRPGCVWNLNWQIRLSIHQSEEQ